MNPLLNFSFKSALTGSNRLTNSLKVSNAFLSCGSFDILGGLSLVASGHEVRDFMVGRRGVPIGFIGLGKSALITDGDRDFALKDAAPESEIAGESGFLIHLKHVRSLHEESCSVSAIATGRRSLAELRRVI